jgi:hypothetical protein
MLSLEQAMAFADALNEHQMARATARFDKLLRHGAGRDQATVPSPRPSPLASPCRAKRCAGHVPGMGGRDHDGGAHPETSAVFPEPFYQESLALILELVGHGHEVIGVKATARAIEWADYLKSHAVRLYSIGSLMAENGARLILEHRAQLPECFTAHQVYRKGWVGLTPILLSARCSGRMAPSGRIETTHRATGR